MLNYFRIIIYIYLAERVTSNVTETNSSNYVTTASNEPEINSSTIMLLSSNETERNSSTNANTVFNSTTTIVYPKNSTTNEGKYSEALRDIAYYLRAHKFNEYDRRYETNGDIAPRRYYKEFPRPPLRSLHWEVHKYCETSFHECIEYLRKRIRYTSLKRVDDTAVVMQEQKWTFTNNADQIKQIDEECKKLRKIDNSVADPFEGPLERFQWRVTASYYMCWYTMQQIPEMEHLSESCDNFADCLDSNLGPNNRDQRADDRLPYRCALYSFCPDPCCPDKHLSRLENCWNSPDNPCFLGNPPGQRECAVNRSLNADFRDIILNRWNVSCGCPKAGYEWNSLYGMCVDMDECTSGRHNCDGKLEACVNLEGSFRCACKWGHIWNDKEKKCTGSPALAVIKLGRRQDDTKRENEAETIFKKIAKFFSKSNKSTDLFSNYIGIYFNALCIFIFLL